MTYWVDIAELHFSRLRPRGAIPNVSIALLESIRRHGPIAPVIVRSDRSGFEILSNAATWLALQRLGHHRVPIEVRDDLTDDAAIDIISAGDSEDVANPIEQARLFADQLVAMGGAGRRGAITRVADQMGLSRTYVSHALRLLSLPDEVQSLLRQGQLVVGHAKPLVNVKDPGDCVSLARKIAFERLSVRAAESMIRRFRNGEPDADPKGSVAEKDPDTKRLERRLSEQLGCGVTIEDGQLVVDYEDSLDVLDGVLERIGYQPI